MCIKGLLRKTVFRRDKVEGVILTYKLPWDDAWTTNLCVYAENENPGIWNEACTRETAERHHEEAIRMVKLMGFETEDA